MSGADLSQAGFESGTSGGPVTDGMISGPWPSSSPTVEELIISGTYQINPNEGRLDDFSAPSSDTGAAMDTLSTTGGPPNSSWK